MDKTINLLTILFLIAGFVITIFTIIVKVVLKSRGKSVNFLYLEISDLRDFFKIHKENKLFTYIYYLFIIFIGVAIVDFISIICLLYYEYYNN